MIKGHGGNVQALAELHNCSIDEIIDMSSNINPLGPPEGVEEFILSNIHLIRSLPEPDAYSMVEAFSRYYNIPSNRVIGGNGTTWFIYTIPLALKSKKILIAGPTYSDYQDSCIMNQAEFEFCMADENSMFQPDIDKISSMAEKADTVILCNPNNPTGSLIQQDDLIELVKYNPQTYFVVDESYLPFIKNAENISLITKTQFPNLIVLSSMSKIFRIPGLRTGYLCADPNVIEKFMKYYQPWSVNALSQAATTHILENPKTINEFLQKTRSFVDIEKTVFQEAVNGTVNINNSESANKFSSSESLDRDKYQNLTLYPAHTYFVLAKLNGSITSDKLCKRVGEHKILIRDCANFHGLSNNFVRFSLRDRETNLKLADILKKITNNL